MGSLLGRARITRIQSLLGKECNNMISRGSRLKTEE